MEGERVETPSINHFFPSIKPDSTSSLKPPPTRRRRKNPKQLTLTEATEHLDLTVTTTTTRSGEGELNKVLSLNKAIRQTLGKEDNPITNSTAYSRATHIQSCATGHQGGGGGGKNWSLHRNEKLRIQAADKITQSLNGVVGYISGYTGEGLNLELKACVERQGGRMIPMASGKCTHIFSTTNLSGSKAQKYFESNKKNKYKLVTPEWAFACERAGKRLSEASFISPIKHELQESLFEIYKSTNSSTSAATLLASTSKSTSSSVPQKRPQLKVVAKEREDQSVADLETIVLSPSPSPKSPQKKRKSEPSAPSSSSKKKKLSHSNSENSERRRRKKKEKIEELLILGSSDVEIEDPHLLREVRPSKEVVKPPNKVGKEVDVEEEEKLDEFGMPPSAQRR
ncbi:hypothetical protein JCM3765_003069 [Sporobolomyces pararoseus]